MNGLVEDKAIALRLLLSLLSKAIRLIGRSGAGVPVDRVLTTIGLLVEDGRVRSPGWGAVGLLAGRPCQVGGSLRQSVAFAPGQDCAVGLSGLAKYESLQKVVKPLEDWVIQRIRTEMRFKQPIEKSKNAATIGKSATAWLLTWAPIRHSNTPMAATPCSSLRKGRKRVNKAFGQPISLRMRKMT